MASTQHSMDELRNYLSKTERKAGKLGARQSALPVMVTCQKCGHPFPSKLIQISRMEFYSAISKKDYEGRKYEETCPKCNKAFEFYGDNFFWKDMITN
jgi:hypothetical protein